MVRRLLVLALLGASTTWMAACGDDGDGGTPGTPDAGDASGDSTPEPDGSDDVDDDTDPTPDSGPDADVGPDIGPDADGGTDTDGGTDADVEPDPDAIPDTDADDDADADTGPVDPPEPILRDDDLNPLLGAWSDEFSVAGLQSDFGAAGLAIVEGPDGTVYVGGSFTTASGVEVQNVASWNGTAWESVGDGLPLRINTMIFDDLGRLWAAGASAGGGFGISPPAEIYYWDGDEWTSIGAISSFSEVKTLAWHAGQLYIGGNFEDIGGEPIASAARWDGTNFFSVANLGDFAEVNALWVTEDEFCLGGSFEELNGAPAGRIACHDGTDWNFFAGGVNSIVNAIHRWDGELVIAGYFNVESETPGRGGIGVAIWDGTEWYAPGGGVEAASVIQARTLATDADGDLLVGGQFGVAGFGDDAVWVGGLGRWDGTSWSAFDEGVANEAVISINDGVFGVLPASNGDVWATGVFSRASTTGAANVARWDGTRWNALSEPDKELIGITGGVRAFASDGVGSLYVGGTFAVIGESGATGIARLSGSTWTAMDEGLGEVNAIAALPDGRVYAGGPFADIGLRAATFFAEWDAASESWRSPTANVDGPVSKMAECPDGTVIVAGDFAEVGDVPAGGIARWTGSAWETFAEGVTTGPGQIGDVACSADGTIWAAGDFGDGTLLLRWNETAWQLVAEFDAQVMALEAYGDSLFVGGFFREIDGEAFALVAEYRDGTFHDMNGGLWTGLSFSFGAVSGLAAKENGVFATGYFNQSIFDDTPANFAAWWDGSAWHGLGEGLNDIADAVVVHDRSAYFGGGFTQAGGLASQGIARWNYRDDD